MALYSVSTILAATGHVGYTHGDPTSDVNNYNQLINSFCIACRDTSNTTSRHRHCQK